MFAFDIKKKKRPIPGLLFTGIFSNISTICLYVIDNKMF